MHMRSTDGTWSRLGDTARVGTPEKVCSRSSGLRDSSQRIDRGCEILAVLATLIALIAASLRRAAPYSVLLVVVLFEQELLSGNADSQAGTLISLGREIYYFELVGKLSIVSVFVLLLIANNLRSLLISSIRGPALLLLLLILWIVGLSIAQGNSISASLASSTRVVAILAAALAAPQVFSDAKRGTFVRILYFTVACKAVLGSIALLSGERQTSDPSATFVFYDSAPLIVAGATLLVASIDRESPPPVKWAGWLSAATLAAMSIRRASLAGVLLAGLILVVVGRRVRALLTLIALMALATVLFLMIEPPAISHLLDSTANALVGLLGGDTDSSTIGHLRDNAEGLSLAMSHPLLGVGVLAGPSASLVVTGGDTLYVHNEFLFAWLHFGIVGPIVLLILLGPLTWRATGILRRGRDSGLERIFGSVVLVALVPGYFFFPHLLTLERFGLLFGLAAGLVAYRPDHTPPGATYSGAPRRSRARRLPRPGSMAIGPRDEQVSPR